MKIKKHISLLLSVLILVSNIGLALNVHYCGNEISAVSLAYKTTGPCVEKQKETPKPCCAAAGESHKKCCKSNVVKPHDKSDNILVKSFQLDLQQFYAVSEWRPLPFYASAVSVKKETPSFYCEANAPPLYKLYCRYILYA